jgi:hypothetical protein
VGPLSGFGATDQNHFREDNNLFGAWDWPLDSSEAAVDFVSQTLAKEVSHNPAMQRPGAASPEISDPNPRP